MATKDEILRLFGEQTGPIQPSELEEAIGQPVKNYMSQIKRLTDDGLLKKNEDGTYIITEQGAKVLNPPTLQSEGMTESEILKDYGRRIGIPQNVVDLTVDYIFNAGDYRDLRWVDAGMQQQGLRQDQRRRWWNTWRGYFKKPMPAELVKEYGPDYSQPQEAGTTAAAPGAAPGAAPAAPGASPAGPASGTSLKRDYILGHDNTPVYVGESLGDMEKEDAMTLSKLRLAAQARQGAISSTGGPADAADQFVRILKAVEAAKGDSSKGKSFIVKPGAQGYEVQELEGDKPVVVNPEGLAPKGDTPKAGSSFLVDNDGNVQEIKAGMPVVIKMGAPSSGGTPPSPAKKYLVQQDGSLKEVVGDQPIIIVREVVKEPAIPAGGPVFNATLQGNPVTINLDTYFKLEDHKAKAERDKESHDVKMDIGKSVKDLLAKGVKAASRMAGE